jgi:VWFA-related protein
LDDAVGGGGIQNSEADNLEDMAASGASVPNLAAITANFREFEAVQESFQLQLRAKYTLDAMNQIARYLSNIPGRKNLIWFSGSFPVNILPDPTGTLADPFAAMGSVEDEFRDTVNLLTRSQVAVYPIDARGLMNSPMMDVTTGSRSVTRAARDEQKFFTETAEEQGTMRQMADATGGRVFVNTNGLTDAVTAAIEEGSNFYTLAYTPTKSLQDGKLRKINVTVSRPGLTLAYRKGYYADNPDDKSAAKADTATTAAGAPTPRDTLRFAMTRGVPPPSEVIFKVGVVPLTPAGQTEDKVAPGNEVSPKTQGPYRRYSVNYSIDPAGLVYLQGPDGKIHVDFDLVIFVFTPDGERVNSRGSSVHIAKSLDDLRKMLDQGLTYHEEISAPAKGEYFLRIGVHELHDDHYGAVEVATSAVRNLHAAKAPAAVPEGTAR